uniref:LIM domain-binding protein 2 n=1 Tax=Aceria tosichella TaxID=561515 RepID=A0A6G1S8G7_9ACAR
MADDDETNADDAGSWDCSLCTLKNSAEKFKCKACGLRRGTSTRKPRCSTDTIVAQVVKQQEQIRQQTIAKPSPKIQTARENPVSTPEPTTSSPHNNNNNNNNIQHDCMMMGGQMNQTGLMHSSLAPSAAQSMRHNHGPPQPLPMQQQQHHMNSHHPMTSQQSSPVPNYHQLPPHPPVSLSASPHQSSTPHSHSQPPPRPSTGPSPLHHHHSPLHVNVSSSPKNPSHGHISMHSRPPSNQLSPHGHNFHNNNTMPSPHGASSHYGQPPPPPQQMSHHQQQHLPQQAPQQSMNHQTQSMMQTAPDMSGGAPPPPPSRPSTGHMSPHPSVHLANQERASPFHHQQHHIPQSELRIIELNKRLQSRPRVRGASSPLPLIGSSDESIWWERFACDFFDDESSLTIRIPGDDKLIEYTIGRPLIPRFFKSYFDGGVTDLSIKLTNIRETQHRSSLVTLECDQADIVTKNIFKHIVTDTLMYVVVHTEGSLSLEFVGNSLDNLVIKSWRFYANQCREYIDRSLTAMGLPSTMLIEPTTIQGFPKSTISYLKICSILEPMQDIMAQHRQSNMDPKSCLKKFLYDKHRFISEEENKVIPTKRRKRKQDTLPVQKKFHHYYYTKEV